MQDPYVETIHYSELPDLPPERVLARELATYKREAGRLIAEGHEGRWVLIKDDAVIGLWETMKAAADAGDRQLGRVPFMVRQVLTRERVLRQRYV